MSDFVQVNPVTRSGAHVGHSLLHRGADREGHAHLVLAGGAHRRDDRGACGCRHRRTDAAAEVRLPRRLVTLGFGEILPEVFRNGDDPRPQPHERHQGNLPGRQRRNGGFCALSGVRQVINSSDFKTQVLRDPCLLRAFRGVVACQLRDGKLGSCVDGHPGGRARRQPDGRPLMRTKLWSYARSARSRAASAAPSTARSSERSTSTLHVPFSIIILCSVDPGWYGQRVGLHRSAGCDHLVRLHGDWRVDQRHVRRINSKEYEFLLFGVVLVVMMLFRRKGFPAARTKQVRQAEKEMLAHRRWDA